MFSRIQSKLGTAGLVVAIVALVAALGGGAYAAQQGLNSKQKKEVKNISKQAAKPGPEGKQGPAGPAGAKGDNGSSGTNGTNGEDGMCSAGNPECVLGTGGMLTGVWSASNPSESGGVFADLSPISFPVRVSPPPTALVTHEFAGFHLGDELKDGSVSIYGPGINSLEEVEESEAAFKAACPGSVGEPEAAPGFLCIYKGVKNGANAAELTEGQAEAANEFGIVVPWQVGAGTNLRGTWAVAG
jgi:hypothetical protein